MSAYVVLLRAVNVGGSGKLPMAELRALCEEIGLGQVRTYIASGNVVCASPKSAAAVKRMLEKRLEQHCGQAVWVLVRTAQEMEGVLAANPFPDAPPAKVLTLFLDKAADPSLLKAAKGRADEEIVLSGREVYIHYPDGQGHSKLTLPIAKTGTGRNMNTVAKLTQMVGEVEG